MDRVRRGADAGPGLAKHGVAAPRGQTAAARGRYGRMFGFLPPAELDPDALEQIAAAMIAAAGHSTENPRIPAGFTYLAQFIDHDITFDPTSRLGRDNDAHELVDFRTPRLDLDSVYGSGPLDQPFLYDWTTEPHPGVRLLVGGTPDCPDLPRNQDHRALTGDGRNDENLIVSQLQLLFLRAHNALVERALGDHPQWPAARVFEEAQRQLRWHYQWVVLHDFLPALAEGQLSQVFMEREIGPPVINRRFFRFRERPFVPLEFSAAFYRFGHSMVREDYAINDEHLSVGILHPSAASPLDLSGFRPLPAELQIQWTRFFGPAAQRSMRIDASLTEALTSLPPDGAALMRLNLERGRALGLPAGRDVVRAMGFRVVSDDNLLAGLPALDPKDHRALLDATPLWYYVLREADVRGGDPDQHLGPAGAQIVSEVLVGLIEADPGSYLRQAPQWKPELPHAGPGFTMADLVDFTRSAPR